MEENNNIDASVAPTAENVQTSTEESVETQVQATKQPEQSKFSHRKNGRNRSASSASTQNSNIVKENCGEINDIANFKEKLSGSNVSGYAEGEAQKNESSDFRRSGERREKFGRRERKPETFSNEGAKEESKESPLKEDANTSNEGQSTREGPSFETQSPNSRPVEVQLHDRRVRSQSANLKSDEGVVSYSSAESCCPSVSFFARVKNMIASIFGKKDSKKKKFNNSKKPYKGNRDAKKFYHGDKKHFDNNRRGGHGRYNNNKNRNFHRNEGNRDGGSASKAD